MNQYYYYPFTSFSVTLPGGGKSDLEKPVSEMEDLDRPRARVLLPGEAYIHAVRLNRWIGYTQPGIYEFTSTYSVKPDEDAKGCWTGTLTSPPIKIRVRPESKPPGELI
jgi:hypothetical protein